MIFLIYIQNEVHVSNAKPARVGELFSSSHSYSLRAPCALCQTVPSLHLYLQNENRITDVFCPSSVRVDVITKPNASEIKSYPTLVWSPAKLTDPPKGRLATTLTQTALLWWLVMQQPTPVKTTNAWDLFLPLKHKSFRIHKSGKRSRDLSLP